MRILHISAQKPDSTGSGVYLRETVRALARKGHDQQVIAGIGPDDAPAFPEGVRFAPVVFETGALPFPVCGMSDEMPYRATRYRDMTPQMVAQFKAAFSAVLERVVGDFDPELIVCHHLYLLTSLVAHRGARCPIVAICHGTDLRQMEKTDLERAWIREGIRELDRVFALHGAQVGQVVASYGIDAERVSVLGTGYDAQLFRSPGPRPARERAELVYVGKIWEKKGVRSLIRALGLLPRERAFRLRLVGGYNDEAEHASIVEQARASGLPLEFCGTRTPGELAVIYGSSDVFVLPSFFEGLPLVLIEALACGCKAVMTDLPGIRPWVEESIEGAPVWWVEPPAMRNADEPDPATLPAFERRLAEAIATAMDAPHVSCDTSGLSWDALAGRLLSAMT